MKASDIPQEIRDALDGKPSEPRTFTQWMNEIGAAERERLFGKLNNVRWEAGTITQTELLRQTGRPLSVADFAG
jgi:hypothetical protein